MIRHLVPAFILFTVMICSGPGHASIGKDPGSPVRDGTVEEFFPLVASVTTTPPLRDCLRISEATNRGDTVTGTLRMKGTDQPFVSPTSTPKWWNPDPCMSKYRKRTPRLVSGSGPYSPSLGYAGYEELLLSKSNAFFSALSEINLLLQFASAGYHSMGPENINGWSPGSFDNFSRGLSTSPQWDSDNFFINYVGHPYAGSCFYLIGRNRGLGIFGSWLVSTCGSVLWEYFYESFYEVPSANDLLFTSNVGFLIGEVSWQLKKILVKSNRTKPTFYKGALIFVTDPWNVVAEKLNLGPLWSTSRSHINPYASQIPRSYLTQRWEE